MAQADDPEYRYDLERGRVKDSELSEQDTELVLEFLAALDPDNMTATFTDDGGRQQTLAYSSLIDYGRALRTIGDELRGELATAGVSDLRQVFTKFSESLADQTVRQRQAAARKFYRYHDFDVEPEEIPLKQVESGSSVDERSTLSKEDIQAVREACDNLRDRAMIELFVYTGQRLRAVQTLRIRDIDLDEGVYYLNTEDAGLKDADKIGAKRPLLGAEKAVRQWIQNHPTGEPEDYLITSLPSATGTNGKGEMLNKVSIYNRLNKLFEKAEVDKPDQQMAHAFRHYFATIAYRDLDMDPTTIKYLMGHTADSTMWESTYQHLEDQDHVEDARRKAGMERGEGDEEESALTPEVCPTCQEPLGPSAKACEECGMIFTPDAKATQEEMKDQLREQKEEAETLEEYKDADKMAQALEDDPELTAELIKKLDGL